MFLTAFSKYDIDKLSRKHVFSACYKLDIFVDIQVIAGNSSISD